MIKCVIFDLDGLMFDTERIARATFKSEGLKYGYDLDDEFFIGITGSASEQVKKHYDRYDGFSAYVPSIIEKRRLNIYKAIETIGALNKEGLVDLLDYLFENKYKVAVATSSPLDYAKKLLASIGKFYPFDVICSREMVTKHKPDPEVFLLAAKNCGIDPENCLVLEDSKNGIIAGTRANMKTCFIEDTIKLDKEIQDIYTYKANNLKEVIEILKNT